MRNILLGVLLVALAAVVVNKKMWKHRTFLMIVLGLMIAMMAVSMVYAGKEMFQTTTATACTNDTINYGAGTINFANAMTGSDTGASVKTSSSGSPVQLVFTDSTASNTGVNSVTLYARARIINYLLSNTCWDRVRQFLIWHMARDSLIFTYMQAATGYSGDLNANSEDRYMNFLQFINTNTYLRGANYDTPTNMGTTSLRGDPVSTTEQSNMFRLLSLMQMVFAFYGLRANTPVNSTNNEKLNVIGVWLNKAMLWNMWPHQPTNRWAIVRRMCVLSTRYINYSLAGFIEATNINWNLNDLIFNMFSTNYMNTKHAIRIYTAGNPATVATVTDIIPQTVNDFYTMMFACFMIKLFALDLNVPVEPNKNSITLANTARTNYTLTNTQTMQDFFNNQLKELMQKILKNVGCHEYISAAATRKGLTPSELDILLRNYMADETKCLQPLDTDAIVAVIDSVNKSTNFPYSVTQLNNNFVPQLYTTALTAQPANVIINEIGVNVRRIMFKSKMDDSNPLTTSTYPEYTKLDIGSYNTGHIRMFNYIFDNKVSDLVPNYFNTDFPMPNGYLQTSTALSTQQYRYLEISPETFVGYVNTNKSNFDSYNSTIGGLNKTTASVAPPTATIVSAPPTATIVPVSSPAPTSASVQGFTPTMQTLEYDPSNLPNGTTIIPNISSSAGPAGTCRNMSVSNGFLDFNGTNSYIEFPAFNFGRTFTISTWIFPNSANTGAQGILANKNNSLTNPGFGFHLNNGTVGQNGNINVWTVDSTPTSWGTATPGNTVMPKSAWVHIAVAISLDNNNSIMFYKNGVMIGMPQAGPANTNANTVPTNLPFRIGTFMDGSFPFKGLLGSLKVFNRILSSTDIQTEFNNTRAKYGTNIMDLASAPAPAGPKLEVFAGSTTGNYEYTNYTQAEAFCGSLGARIATVAELATAQQQGAEWCFNGFVKKADGTFTKQWPMQRSGVSGCGNPGINTWDSAANAGAVCYGVKPNADGAKYKVWSEATTPATYRMP